MTKHLDQPQRRLRPSVVDTVDMLAEYDGVIFTLADLEDAVRYNGLEWPISGDDIARATHRV